ncbi:MAG: triose-phosphate isomerase [Desulfovibrionaceae bacterium]|nr:triose-phosphate isomerase [Desulfovibrionaceae bacterium]
MPPKLMAANWKMYKTTAQARVCAEELCKLLPTVPDQREVLVCPPFTAIAAIAAVFAGKPGFLTGAQNVYPKEEGAFTGEISPEMLKDAGARWVLTGHSERRSIFGESDAQIGLKTAFALAQGLNAVLCIGETLAQREAGQLAQVLAQQLAAGLADVPPSCPPSCLAVAYEPVWAIGTGKVAGPKEILEAHALVRTLLCEKLGMNRELRILYGGSVKPDNAHEIIGLDNVDGVLVGGASLQAESFSRIVRA